MIEKTGRTGAADEKGDKVADAMRQAGRLMLCVTMAAMMSTQSLATDQPKIRILNEAPGKLDPANRKSAATAAPAAPPELRWTMSWWGLPRPATAGSERLAELIRIKTDGRWTIKIHYGAALSRADQNLDGLREGHFQMAAFCDFFHPKKNPALTVLSLPFLPIATPQTNRRVRDAVYAHPAIQAEFGDLGVRLYVSTYLPRFELIGRGTPPSGVGYWKGRAVRAGGGIGRAMTVLGAIPVNAKLPEIADGLRDGAIQAAALPLAYALTDGTIRSAAKWYTLNLAAGSADCPIAISEAAYAKLPKDYKNLLAAVRPAVIDAQLRAYRPPDELNSHTGPQRIVLSPAEITAYRKAAGRPVIDAWIERHQTHFDALALVRTVFAAGGLSYE
jgi:TRAP-type C4-dicarboxylate transport system substrate-binding protein